MTHKRKIGLGLLATLVFQLLCANQPVMAAAPAPKARAARRRTVSKLDPFVDPTKDDVTGDDDPVVRAAAVEALGRYYGSVVAIDPTSGRILSIVNQKLAFSDGFIPCSTIKPVIALAALEEGVVTADTVIHVSRRKSFNMTEAIAHSNNPYFEELGRRMGFDTVAGYARMVGLGELAGYNIPEEQPGTVPSEPPKRGGVARMSSFGQGIEMTPLQLGALASAIANGGTLYYLQYPRTEEDKENFQPLIKRMFELDSPLKDVREGMAAAVLRGTARRSYISDDEQASGKTGSCSEEGTRLGWFASFADQVNPKIVLVILIRGHSHAVQGPMAAGIAGRIYRRLNEENYFAQHARETATPTLTSSINQ